MGWVMGFFPEPLLMTIDKYYYMMVMFDLYDYIRCIIIACVA